MCLFVRAYQPNGNKVRKSPHIRKTSWSRVRRRDDFSDVAGILEQKPETASISARGAQHQHSHSRSWSAESWQGPSKTADSSKQLFLSFARFLSFLCSTHFSSNMTGNCHLTRTCAAAEAQSLDTDFLPHWHDAPTSIPLALTCQELRTCCDLSKNIPLASGTNLSFQAKSGGTKHGVWCRQR